MEDFIYIGFVAAFAFDFVPRGWLLCDGRTVKITDYAALYGLLGTRFGGDGRATFGLPDLRGRAAVGFINNDVKVNDLTIIYAKPFAYKGGSESLVLSTRNLPTHSHLAAVTTGQGAISGTVTAKMNVSTVGAAEFTPDSNYLAADAGIGTPFYNKDATAGKSLNTNAITVDASKLAINLSGFGVTVGNAGDNLPVADIHPYQALNYCISCAGIFPERA